MIEFSVKNIKKKINIYIIEYNVSGYFLKLLVGNVIRV